MDDRLNRIEQKLDKLVEVQTVIQIDVAEHIRRTEIAEHNIEEIAKEIKPIQEHVAFLRIGGKLLGALSVFVAIATGIYQLIGGN